MAITVQHGKDDITTHEDSQRWHIDEDGRLHIVGEGGGNVASYNNGYWANVKREDLAATAGSEPR